MNPALLAEITIYQPTLIALALATLISDSDAQSIDYALWLASGHHSHLGPVPGCGIRDGVTCGSSWCRQTSSRANAVPENHFGGLLCHRRVENSGKFLRIDYFDTTQPQINRLDSQSNRFCTFPPRRIGGLATADVKSIPWKTDMARSNRIKRECVIMQILEGTTTSTLTQLFWRLRHARSPRM
jgi:hypothetical protein